MAIIGKVVKHPTFGIGEVESIEGQILTVRFSAMSKRFQYPSAFEQFLVAVDETVNAEIHEEIERLHQEKLEKEREVAVAASQAEVDHHRASVQTRPRDEDSDDTRSEKRQTFYVFQGRTYQQESRGGYIWAPISPMDGKKFPHWERLLDVHPGDVIFHGCQAKIMAISVAKGECYDAPQPAELENFWAREGRRVDCEYYTLRNPIPTNRFRTDIIRLCQVKNAPFNRNGNGNMGYLFALNQVLARVFLRGVLGENEYLRQVRELMEVLEE